MGVTGALPTLGRRAVLAGFASAVGIGISGGSGISAKAPNVFAATADPEGPTRRWRVAVIGHTGRGNYGHGLDTVWLKLDQTRIVAVADADPEGLRAAQRRLRVDAGFADYRRMLREIRPEIVAICPRHPDQHAEMTLAAIDAGVRGIYMEKPFCRTPAEADAIVEACDAHEVKLAVAHRNRYHPSLEAIDRLVRDGGIGRLLEIRGRGKGDRRGGGEDLWVLGSHVLNLAHYFGGPATHCSAVVLREGRRVTAEDVREGNEALGPLAGDELHARYRTRNGVTVYFDSIANDGSGGEGFGLQLIGSEGTVRMHCDRHPFAHRIPGSPFAIPNEAPPAIPISSAGPGEPEPMAEMPGRLMDHRIPVEDLLSTIGTGRRPRCDAREAAMTVEMIMAVYASHQAGSAEVAIPLADRNHPLAAPSS